MAQTRTTKGYPKSAVLKMGENVDVRLLKGKMMEQSSFNRRFVLVEAFLVSSPKLSSVSFSDFWRSLIFLSNSSNSFCAPWMYEILCVAVDCTCSYSDLMRVSSSLRIRVASKPWSAAPRISCNAFSSMVLDGADELLHINGSRLFLLVTCLIKEINRNWWSSLAQWNTKSLLLNYTKGDL